MDIPILTPMLILTISTLPLIPKSWPWSGTRWGGCRRRSAALRPPTLWRRRGRIYEIRQLFTFLILSQTGSAHSFTVAGGLSNRYKCKIISCSAVLLIFACPYLQLKIGQLTFWGKSNTLVSSFRELGLSNSRKSGLKTKIGETWTWNSDSCCKI